MKRILNLIFLATIFVLPGKSSQKLGQVWAPTTPFRPALRDEISLNGVWSFTPENGAKDSICVPEFWDAQPGFKTSIATYSRSVSVPSDWAGKKTFVEFEGVNHIATVYVDSILIGTHYGGWVPFKFDISSFVSAGATFKLTVLVKGGNHQPIVTSDGTPSFPMGWKGRESRWGIIHPVWIRAYGEVSIDDAFIKPSFRNKTLTIDYTIVNRGSKSSKLTLSANIRDSSNVTQLSIAKKTITIAPGERKIVSVVTKWDNPVLWSPANPELLYCDSYLTEDNRIVDSEKRQFGFKELWIEGNHYRLNGVRINFIGSSNHGHCQEYDTDRYTRMMPSSWTRTIDQYKALNHNILRMHMEPLPDWMLDVCDQKGFLIIQESAIYAYGDKVMPSDKELFMSNCIQWLREWVPGFRNHPCVALISCENEMKWFWNYLNNDDVKMLADTVNAYDPTRPVIAEGERECGIKTINLHYPEGYNVSPSGSIYGWSDTLFTNKPTGIGEFITDYGPSDNKWWQGTWCRGMRYLNFTDIRPYTTAWALASSDNQVTNDQVSNLKNSFAPIALFDKEYDDFGIGSAKGTSYPVLIAGENVQRTLILYNDELEDSTITVKADIVSGPTVHLTMTKTFTVTPGEHIEFPFAFQVPDVAGSSCKLVLSTSKGGVQKFIEERIFTVTDKGLSKAIAPGR